MTQRFWRRDTKRSACPFQELEQACGLQWPIVQERHGVGAIPVLMFSGQVESEEEARDRGAQGFVGKPFDLQHLIDQTKQILPT